MAINKVEANGETLIDLTSDTATASDVIKGKTLHLASGTVATGTYRPSDEIEARLRATVGHSSKNLLDMNKYYSSTVSNIQINEGSGSLSCTGTGTWCGVGYFYLTNDLSSKPNGITYILTCINNLATSDSMLAVRRRDTNVIMYAASLSTTGKKELKFTASSEKFPNGWYISILATRGTSTTGSVDISNLMLREASIADDDFEPYQTPTDDRFKEYLPLSLWEAAEAQAPSSVTIPNPDCERYIVTVLLGSSNATTFDIDADYIGKTWLDANCGLSTSVNGDNLNFMLAIHPGTFDTIKIVKIVGIPK